MKKIIALLVLMLTTAALVPINGQNVNVNINVNIDRQPAWGPVGYEYVEFYYFPELNVYYDVNQQLFHYKVRRSWISGRYLPYKYSKYDLYTSYKVILSGPTPWIQNKVHKKYYKPLRNVRTQLIIRNSTLPRYKQSRNNSFVWVVERPVVTKVVTERVSSPPKKNAPVYKDKPSNHLTGSSGNSGKSSSSNKSTTTSSANQAANGRATSSSTSSSSRTTTNRSSASSGSTSTNSSPATTNNSSRSSSGNRSTASSGSNSGNSSSTTNSSSSSRTTANRSTTSSGSTTSSSTTTTNSNRSSTPSRSTVSSGSSSNSSTNSSRSSSTTTNSSSRSSTSAARSR